MRWLVMMAPLIIALTAWGQPAFAADSVISFDPAQGQFPEGIAFDHQGAMYVSLAPLGQILKFEPDGSSSTFASFEPGTSGLAVLGLASDQLGTIYAAVPSDAPSAHGVWAIAPNGEATRLSGSERIVFPNALAFDHHGTLYVTDSIPGAIWRIAPGAPAELWLQHETLAGLAVLNPFPLGANGIAYFRGRLLVANTEKRQLVDIPILHGGAPGEPSIIFSFSGATEFLDGVAVDVAGNIYVLVAGTSELVRIARSGEATTIAGSADGLNVPVSLAFGTRGSGRQTLYITNLSLPTLTPSPTPGVIAVGVDLPGPPLPRGLR